MKLLSDVQEIARRFNGEEAIWRRFWKKRLTRRLLPLAASSVPEIILDQLDWLESERGTGVIRAVTQRKSQ